MNPIQLSPSDLAIAASLVAFDALLSVGLRLQLHRQILWAAGRMVVQLVAVGYLMRLVFAMHHPAATLALVVLMAAVAAREIAARPEKRFKGFSGLTLSAGGVAIATAVTVGLALLTAIRPHPWYDPRYAISLAGIILGAVLNAGSLALDSILGRVQRERSSIEAQLALGVSFHQAIAPLLRDSIRRGLLPIINQMSAAGVITLPGIMTGQILAGLDPVEAVKYQILLMFLLAGASGLAALLIAYGAVRRLTDPRQRLRLDRLR
ncbi:iron export ABC transporter permease subunit FetB [Phenylobacterium hankyongense]|uniref:Iron export ABC transporter permease subunit FetB n=1 Tax=Phenylobacterium hankyongense TaxID=1813876 RepID=A0A328AXE6_9CAUL|nr:iron export ABC transporter permease subunit FetB [Phenylobacterium hankyongense]RAK59329.1 iron export ABC transporter permease subunit FetB [Phenylobacterium hankyongense]